jgi:hypothetical protein
MGLNPLAIKEKEMKLSKELIEIIVVGILILVGTPIAVMMGNAAGKADAAAIANLKVK